MKSKARKVIEKWIDLPYRDMHPVYLGQGMAFLYPSESEPWGPPHVVVWFPRERGGDHFVCGGCKGFLNSGEDLCRHVRDLKEKIEAGLAKIDRKG